MLPWILLVSAAVADLPPPAARPVDFVGDIRPILRRACFKCHGPEKQRGGLRLDVRSAVLKGGDSEEPAILPGKSATALSSGSWRASIPTSRCRRKATRSPRKKSASCEAWINGGAVWPGDAGAEVEDPMATHWAFRTVSRPAVPTTRERERGSAIPSMRSSRRSSPGAASRCPRKPTGGH